MADDVFIKPGIPSPAWDSEESEIAQKQQMFRL